MAYAFYSVAACVVACIFMGCVDELRESTIGLMLDVPDSRFWVVVYSVLVSLCIGTIGILGYAMAFVNGPVV